MAGCDWLLAQAAPLWVRVDFKIKIQFRMGWLSADIGLYFPALRPWPKFSFGGRHAGILWGTHGLYPCGVLCLSSLECPLSLHPRDSEGGSHASFPLEYPAHVRLLLVGRWYFDV